MSHVNPTLPQPGDEINASDISTPINQIKDVINGGLDDSNFGVLNGSKIAGDSVSAAQLANGSVTFDKLSPSLRPIIKRSISTFHAGNFWETFEGLESPQVVVPASGIVKIEFVCNIYKPTASSIYKIGYSMTGSNTRNDQSFMVFGQFAGNLDHSVTFVDYMDGLTPGSTTIIPKMHCAGVQVYYDMRCFAVTPIP